MFIMFWCHILLDKWFDIDHSFLTYKKELLEYGYEVAKISIKEKYVLI